MSSHCIAICCTNYSLAFKVDRGQVRGLVNVQELTITLHNLWLLAMLLLLSLQLEICSTFLLVSLLLFIYYLNFQYMYAWVSLPIPWIGICGVVQTGRSFVFLAFYPFGPLLSPLEQEHMRIQKKFYFTSLKSILSILLSHFITHLIF